jgi:phosphoserine phosphatase RsbU/P
MIREKDKILIADDSTHSTQIITEILQIVSLDVELFYAENGRQACDIALEKIPDLILMDILMPEMNGIEAIKFLRNNESTAKIPIIVLSATESLEIAWEAGANDFISKPYQNYELLIKVRSALYLVQMVKEIRSQKLELEKKHREVLEQNEKISRQSKEILDDIRYSKRIQRAILPTDEYLHQVLPEHFILNIPKNIVSGDFYWLGEHGDRKIVAVADCTGHGISGAFMTMAGAAFLNEISGLRTVTSASDILFHLRELVMKLLKQKGEEGETPDGMDISLVIIEKDGDKIQFSGANNPLYIISEGQLKIIQGDRMPIGIHLDFNNPFTCHESEIKPGDMIYMFTDGYADQFGGPNNKKFRYRQFQELLLSIHELPLTEQKDRLLRTIADWRGDNIQVDDILILGFKL